MSSLSSVAVRGAATTFTGQWSKFLIQTASVVVLARLLSPDDYGVVAMVTAVTGVAFLLGDFGLSLASIQAKEVTRQQRTNLFWVNVGVGTVLATITVVCAPLLASLYDRSEVVNVARWIAVMFLTEAACAQFRAESSRNFRFGVLAVSDVGSQALGLAVGITMAATGAGYWALVGQQLGVSLGRLLIIAPTARWFPSLPRRASIRSFVGFGLNTLGLQLLNYVSSNADNVLIGRYVGGAQLGLYSRAYQLFRLPLQQIASPLTRVAVPVLSRIEDDAQYEHYVRRAQMVLTYSLCGSFLLAAGVAQPLVELVLGDTFAGSADLFALLAIGGVFQALGYVYYWVFTSRALTGVQLRIGVVSRVSMVGFMVIGVLDGARGVAIGAAAGLALNYALLTWFGLPRARLSRRRVVASALRPLAVVGVAAVASFVLTRVVLTDRPAWSSLVLALVVDVLILGAAYVAVPGVRGDVRIIRRAGRGVAGRRRRRDPAVAS